MTLQSVHSYTEILLASTNLQKRAIGTFFDFIERKTGAALVRETIGDLSFSTEIGRALRQAGIIRGIRRVSNDLFDEPPMHSWRVQFSDDDSGGGSSATSDTQALMSALAEALERHLWRADVTVFSQLVVASQKEMRASGRRHIAIDQFAGFTMQQRLKFNQLALDEDTPLRWIRGRDDKDQFLYIPAQTALAAHKREHKHEPLIRPIITTGLATAPSHRDALIAGALEIFERDAFMILWLNQLTYPRIDIEQLTKEDVELREIVLRAKRYRLHIDAVRMLSDAPAHAVLAIVQDVSEHSTAPFIVGMGCRQSLAQATAHAIREALRIRTSARSFYSKMDATKIVPAEIRHMERVPYWLHGNRWHRLRFLAQGSLSMPPSFEWERDAPDAYLERIKAWCKSLNYTFASVSLGKSKGANPTPWYVESVVIPELQPMHIQERYQCIGGERIRAIPSRFGYAPRSEPFTEEPHPFA